jgi:hypothetical protein
MIRKLLQVFLLLCLSVFAAAVPGVAQDKTDADAIAQLQREGWTIVSDGVLRRELRAGEVENFVFGVKGFAWKLQDLRLQYRRLLAAYEVTPTAELKRAIANHRKEIASTMETLRRARAAEKRSLADDLKVSCSINFSYNATAGPRTDLQGVWANASASFNANCGFTGEVYAYATGTVWINGGPYNVAVTDGPRSGGNVTASASVNVAGGSPCDSYAYASMTSNNLNPSSYSMAATNASCPAPNPPPVITISGPLSVDLRISYCKTVSWSSTVSGGTAPLTYSWTVDGYQMGTGNSFSLYVCRGEYWDGGFTLEARVTDSQSRWDTDSRWVNVLEPIGCEDPCLCASPADATAPIQCQ